MNDRDLLRQIGRSTGKKAGYKQLVRELGLGGGRERRMLLEQLTRLTAGGELTKLDREYWGLPRAPGTREDLMAGRLDLHRDGYGFVRPNAGQAVKKEDIFIPPNEMSGAMQGDQVLVELSPAKADGRQQGRVVRVLERKNPTVVGIFHYGRTEREQGHRVTPFDDRMTQQVLIPDGEELPLAESAWATPHRVLGERLNRGDQEASLEGMVVDVEITSWPTPTRPPIGRVIEVLGYADDFGVDVEIMIRKHQLPRIFPEKVLEEARAVAHLDPQEIERRVAQGSDFRDRTIVTIDGETARDFDDAVRVTERDEGGYTLEVHIADVSEYVQPSTALDLEARLRGTSVYFPDRALPMLPHELSSEICSLKPDEDRLVLSCLMNLSSEGRIESYEVIEGVIRSSARMTYTDVSSILDGDERVGERYRALVPDFERMRRLAGLMNKVREERGSIDFDLPEPVIEFDEQGQMRGVTKAERTWANRLIEEFMLAANECVATWIEGLGVPSLYRIHEKPEPRRVVEFEEQAASFGYSLGLGALPVKRIQTRGDRREAQRGGRAARTHEVAEDIPVTPRMYQKLADKIEGRPEERILSYLMLRSLKQAKYSEVNEGHFALAAPSYTHFTSPIRRYPDLIVHRIAKDLLRRGVSGSGVMGEVQHGSPWANQNEGTVRRVGGFPVTSPYDAKAARHIDANADPSAALRSDRDDRARVGVGDKDRILERAEKGLRIPDRAALDMPILESPIPESELAQIAVETSQTERRAAEAERELMEWKKIRFMEDRVGEEFSALVLNPAKYGLFVELIDLFVEGLVPIDSLRDDRYTWRENTHEIMGERNGRCFRAGDRVQVVLDRVLAQERRLQFSIVEEGIPLTGRRAAAKAKKIKSQRAVVRVRDVSSGGKSAGGVKKKKKHLARKGKRR